MIALAAVVVALRRAGVDRPSLQAAARAFAKVSWSAMGVAFLTGIAQVELLYEAHSESRGRDTIERVAIDGRSR